MTDHSQYRLGKHAPIVDPRVPHISKHMMMVQPKPACDWTAKVKSWPMLANDTVGDCTAAGCLHLLQLWLNNNGFDYMPTDAEALALYSATSDYPKSDDGAVEQTVLSYWASKGIPGPFNTDIVTFASLNPQNIDELKLSVENFGGCYLGLALPISAQTQDVWDVTPDGMTGVGMPGSWGGHCVPAVAYDEQYVTVVTWGKLLKVTPAFLEIYLDEAYAVVSRNWLADSGISPPGLNWQGLMDDMRAITA
jgi:hypothetical protein